MYSLGKCLKTSSTLVSYCSNIGAINPQHNSSCTLVRYCSSIGSIGTQHVNSNNPKLINAASRKSHSELLDYVLAKKNIVPSSVADSLSNPQNYQTVSYHNAFKQNYSGPLYPVRSEKPPPPLTANIAVETIAAELSEIFGFDRYYSYFIAKNQHRLYSTRFFISYSQSRIYLDNQQLMTRVPDIIESIKALKTISVEPELIYRLPFLLQLPANKMLSGFESLRKSRLFKNDTEWQAVPLLLFDDYLLRVIQVLKSDLRYFNDFPTRLHFMADALKVCLATLCATVMNASRSGGFFEIERNRIMNYFAMLHFYRVNKKSSLYYLNYCKSHCCRNHVRLHEYAVAQGPQIIAALSYASQHYIEVEPTYCFLGVTSRVVERDPSYPPPRIDLFTSKTTCFSPRSKCRLLSSEKHQTSLTREETEEILKRYTPLPPVLLSASLKVYRTYLKNLRNRVV